MPLILLSGYPSSGLTHRANQLITYFTKHTPSSASNFNIVHISDDTLSIPRSAYDNARSEKDARAGLSSAIKRSLGRETLVIADAMNYIKGFRYQMWCEAKAAGTGCCVVHVAANPAQARILHERRRGGSESQMDENVTQSNPSDQNEEALSNPALQSDSDRPRPPSYASETFENLISRYEEPSASARWDSPLFTVPYDDADPPYEAIAAALFSAGGNTAKTKIKKGFNPSISNGAVNSGTTNSVSESNGTGTDDVASIASSSTTSPGMTKGKSIKPHLATVAPANMSSNALYILEKETNDIVKSIMNYITTCGIGECSSETIDLSKSNNGSAFDETAHGEEGGGGGGGRGRGAEGGREEDETASSQTLHLTLPPTGRLSIAHLQRLRRQFVTLYRSRGVGMGAASSGGKGGLRSGDLDGEAVRRAFVGFLQAGFEIDG